MVSKKEEVFVGSNVRHQNRIGWLRRLIESGMRRCVSDFLLRNF